ncbi:hypothetical protein JYT43_00335 [Ahrensia sp. AH-315-G08]|nr:hypothetical protein [Ahrensia sp. AH-315-G08]
MTPKPVRTRLVLYFPGFEALNSKSQMDRLKFNAEKSEKIWDFKYNCRSVEGGDSDNCVISTSQTSGKDWKVDTRFVLFDWSDIAKSYLNTPFPGNLYKYFPSFLAFFIDGTSFRYFKTSKRYWAFSITPLFFMLAFFLVSWLTIATAVSILAPDVTGWTATSIKMLLSTLLTIILFKWPGDRLHLNLTVNMSGFIRNMANGGNSENDARIEKFAGILTKEIKAQKYDEILIVGHSIGVVWGVLALSAALKANPEILKSANTTFLALGSNLPRTALAPCAEYLRDHIRHIMNCPDLFWHEFMTKDDIVSFYKADTMKILGVSNPKAKYVIDCVRFKPAMLPARYKKMRKSFYRTHKQYVLYHDKPVYFDFILRCFGPFLSRELASDRNWVEKYFGNKNRKDT